MILRKKFDSLQEISEVLTPNDEYENFVNAHIEEAAECIPTKLRAENRVSWETFEVRKKGDKVKTASLCNKRNPIKSNTQKLKEAQREQINTYKKEQSEYIQGHIDDIRNSVADRQFRNVWQTVNEVRKRAKLKAACQEERILIWKEDFKNLLGKSPKVTDKPITKIINNQLDIKLRQFIQEGLDVVPTRIKNWKAAGLDKIQPELEDKKIRCLPTPILQRRI